jgi:branched-chain amino acid transport system permease protein
VLGVTQLVALKLDPASGLMYGHIVFILILIMAPSGLAGAFRR